jgi:hypothetical protein
LEPRTDGPILDRSPEEAKKIAEAAAQTDGIIFHLWWPDDGKAPNGTVKHAQSVGHKELTAKEYTPSDTGKSRGKSPSWCETSTGFFVSILSRLDRPLMFSCLRRGQTALAPRVPFE